MKEFIKNLTSNCTGVGWILGGILKFGCQLSSFRVYWGGVDFGWNFKIWSVTLPLLNYIICKSM